MVEPASLHITKAADEADGLDHSQNNRHITGDLGDLLLAVGAALLHTLQSGDRDGQQLHDDGGVDVGSNAHGHDGHVGEVTTSHHVEQVQNGEAGGGSLHRGVIYAGSRNHTNQTENNQHAEGVYELLANVFNLPRIAKRLPHASFLVSVFGHLTSPRLSRRPPRSFP